MLSSNTHMSESGEIPQAMKELQFAGTRIICQSAELDSMPESEQKTFFTALASFDANAGSSGHAAESKRQVSGRGSVSRYVFSNGRAAIIRAYRRGGWVAQLTSRLFLKSGNAYRPVQELNVLARLFALSLPVPEPVCCLLRSHCFGIFYSGVIASWEIPSAKNALTILDEKQAEARLIPIAEQAGEIAGKALHAGFEHGDLHLGNILLSGEKIFVIDWDKTRSSDKESKLRLAARFRRSVIKHQLSKAVAEAFRRGLEAS